MPATTHRQHLLSTAPAVPTETKPKECFRNRQMVCIAWRDLAGWADLEEVMQAMSALADACLRGAIDWLVADAVAAGEVPRHEDGSVMSLVIIAMGKLGGHELNFSSDIDLIFTITPATNQLKSLANKFDFADATGSEFDIVFDALAF